MDPRRRIDDLINGLVPALVILLGVLLVALVRYVLS